MDVNQSEQIFSGIIAFLEKLRQRGFAIGVDTHVRVIAVMKHLALQKIDDDALYEQRLMLSLRALLVCDEVQQEEFAAFFEKNKHLLFEIEKPINTGITAPEKETKKEPKRIKKRWFVLAGVLLLGIITTIVLLQKQKSDIEWSENRINTKLQDKIDSFKAEKDMHCRVFALAEAQAKFDNLRDSLYPPKTPKLQQPNRIIDEPYYPQFDTIAIPPLPLPQANKAPIAASWWSMNGRWLLGSVMVMVLAFAGLWAFYTWLRDRRYQYAIQSDRGKQPPYFVPLRWENKATITQEDAKMNALLPQLRGREQTAHWRLDIRKTVEASARKAGKLRPQYRQQERAVEYVVLIDEQARHSHQTALFNHLYKTLFEEEVPIYRYFFYGDASFIWNEQHQNGLNIEQLHHLHPNARLLFFATGYSFINPFSGELNDWLHQFGAWDNRALLSPTPTGAWSYKETLLAKFFVVLPAHIDGLVEVVEHFERHSTSDLRQWKYNWAHRSPAIDLHEWDYELEGKEEREITDKDCQRFKTDLLRWYSVDLLQWIAACALYPELQWDLTLALGKTLSPSENNSLLTIENLIAINRLPWFVQGHIPSKYRILLLGVLEEEKQKAALQTINDLLKTAVKGLPNNSVAYQTAQMQLVLNEALLAETRPEQRCQLDKYRQLYYEGANADFVSVAKLRAKIPLSKLALSLPEGVSGFLFKRGDGLLGWTKRAFALVLLLICLSLGLAWYTVPEPIETTTEICDKYYHLKDKKDSIYADFQRFLCGEKPIENLRFWLAVQDGDIQKELEVYLHNQTIHKVNAHQYSALGYWMEVDVPTQTDRLLFLHLKGLQAFYTGDKLLAQGYRDSILAANADYFKNPPVPNLYHLLKYDFVAATKNGMTRVVKSRKYGFLDSLGNEIATGYDEAYNFVGDSAIVKKDGKTYKMDKKGAIREIANVFVLQGAVAMDSSRFLPLVGVEVWVADKKVATTDATGHFQIESPTASLNAELRFPGYLPQLVILNEMQTFRLKKENSVAPEPNPNPVPAPPTPNADRFIETIREEQANGLVLTKVFLVWECGAEVDDLEELFTQESLNELSKTLNTINVNSNILAVNMDIKTEFDVACTEGDRGRFWTIWNHNNSIKETIISLTITNFKKKFNVELSEKTPYENPHTKRAAMVAILSSDLPKVGNKKNNADPLDIEMVFVQGGIFKMGCAETPCGEDEKPLHTVTLNDFYIGKYEVTQAQWKAVMGKNPSLSSPNCERCPVENISWNDIQLFLKRLNQRAGKKYMTYRLPTEAEWEYVAKGGSQSKNYSFSGSNNADVVAWFNANTNRTASVGLKTPNEIGTYDMSGNVWEWCSDWYGAYHATRSKNPQGPNAGMYKVLRGGSWIDDRQKCYTTTRERALPDSRFGGGGFRLVLEIQPSNRGQL